MSKKTPILIAEDDPVQTKILANTFLKENHEIVMVKNGRIALKNIKINYYPIVITDWMMPEMTGIELCKAIRRQRRKAYTYIIILTTKNSSRDIVQGFKAGADDYLSKPFNRAELRARVNTGIRIIELEQSLLKANKEIKQVSVADPLTGCYNRRYMTNQLPREIQRSRRYKRAISLVMCDLDNFKDINDKYGHNIGDNVLKDFVSSVNRSIRQDIDWVVRYGGEEFLIVLPETDTNGAYNLAERIRSDIASKPSKINGKKVNFTASFGVTGFDSENDDKQVLINAMISQADENLYEAKKSGRNRVIGTHRDS